MEKSQIIDLNILTKAKKINSSLLLKYNITAEQVYLIYHDIKDKPKCYCGSHLKFISFKDGYTKYCSQYCSVHTSGIKKEVNKQIINKEFFNTLNRIKGRKLLEYNITAEQVYLIYHDIKDKPKCYCGNDLNFLNFKDGYNKHCSYKCSSNNTETNIRRVKSNQKLAEINFLNLENLNYEFCINNFVSNDLFLMDEFRTYFNFSDTTSYIKKEQLKINTPNKSNKFITQQKIFEYIDISNKLINDRILLDGKELDILTEKFAIEYNGLMFHSYGISKHSMFNNVLEENKKYHLFKTELCETKGIQLFHIFENEWLESRTQNIWKSVIDNKLGLNQKIYARKTIVKEITSKEARDFCIENHLQGYSNSSIRLGLFYEEDEEELVSVMTFAKPRYSKKYQYELIRFCTKTRLNVVGGASKLLKYFERIYKPKSLVSYANRRWSQGNVYEKLGFEFSHNTEPGYFYFKENQYSLFSRNNFQKHKLKDLEHYSEERTESEIMFLEGYRRIWDCGNKVYFKEYLHIINT